MMRLYGVGVIFGFFMLIFLLLNLLGIIFWIWMLIDCIQRDFNDRIEKVMWIIALLLFNWVAAIIYYFVVKR